MKENLDHWNVNEVIKLYGIKSKTALLNAEKSGRIPEAKRDEKNIRKWSIHELPSIGSHYGLLQKPKDFSFTVLCVFTVKGGVLKTTITYVLARILALHGLKVLVVGNDPQTSITQVMLNPLVRNKSLEDLPSYQDVGDVIFEGIPLKGVVQKTNLPTLDLLPETKALSEVADAMGTIAALAASKGKEEEGRGRHKYFSEKLNPLIQEAGYDIAIYDNGPGLGALSENALYASDYWITPNACDQGSYQVFEDNFNLVLDFARRKDKEWNRIFLVPTVREATNLSKQIFGTYHTKFPNYITSASIRSTVRAQEALSLGASPPEVFLESDIAKDFMDLTIEIWKEILENQKGLRDGH